MAGCSVEGCVRKHHGLDYCQFHYARFKRHGDAGQPELLRDPTRTCTVQGCDRPHGSRGLCSMHVQRFWKDGDPGEAAPRRRVGVPTSYGAAHRLLRRTRGPASSHMCVDCGAQAQQWSYRGGSPRELTARHPWHDATRTVAFSPDPDDYDPRCRSCHWRFDTRR